MGFLDSLWDETLAGPAPDKGLDKLRRYKSLSAVRSPDHPIVTNTTTRDDDDRTVPVSRSITILRPKSLTVDPGSGSGPGSAASSPSSSSSSPSSGPSSPFSLGGMGKSPEVKRRGMLTKKPAFQPSEYVEASSPVYDWIMISALDR